MYRENDFLMRPDTAGDDFIRQLLESDNNDKVNGKGDCYGKYDCDGRGDAREENYGSCDVRKGWGLHGYPLAMVYSPVQEWKSLYDNELGLSRGTIFKELELPFHGAWNDEGGAACKIGCGGQKNG